MMVHSDGIMTNVEHASSTSQLDPVKGNGHIQQGVGGQPSRGNGDAKKGHIQASLEQSTFGVILGHPSLYGNDGTMCRRPERVKIIVKRKVVPDELVREGPNKKQKESSPPDVGGGEQRLGQLKGSSGHEVSGLKTEVEVEGEELAVGGGCSGCAVPLRPRQSLGLFNQNGDVAPSTAEDGHSHVCGLGLSTGIGDNTASSAYPDTALLQPTSSSTLSPSPFSLLSHYEPKPNFSPKELSPLAQMSNWEIKECSPRPERGVQKDDHGELTQESLLGDGGREGPHRSIDACEPASPMNRAGSGGGLEHPCTPKAKRTPLFFPPMESAFLLSSLSHPANPPVASSPSPAKRSPLPLPIIKGHLPVATPSQSADFEDASADDHEQVLPKEEIDPGSTQPQSRADVEVGELVREERLIHGDKYSTDEEQEQETDNSEYADEPRYDLEADLNAEDDEDETDHTAHAENVFDDADLGNDDLLKMDIPIFGQNPEGSVPAEDLDVLDEDDLSYDGFAETLKTDIPVLDQDRSNSTEAEIQPGSDVVAQLGEALTHLQKCGNALQQDPSLQMPSAFVASSTPGYPKLSFQSLVNADLGDNDDGDAESVSQEIEVDSDQLDETTGDETSGTSTSQFSHDMLEEQKGVSSARPARHGESYVCSRCGAIKTKHRCLGGVWTGELDSLECNSPSSEKPETSGRPARLDGLGSHCKAISCQSVKLKVKDSTELVVSALPVFSPSESRSRVKRLKIKMSSKVCVKKEAVPIPARTLSIKEAPTTAKALLATGVLAGYHVRYLDRHGRVMLTGRIDDTGIICDCSKCRGKQTVNVSAFEKHAGSTARHPSDFIYLDNGKNLHKVMEAGWKAAENGRKVSEALNDALQLDSFKTDPNTCAECGTGGTELTCRGAQCSNFYHLECAGLSLPPDGDWQCSKCHSTENHRRSSKTNPWITREMSTGKDSNANMHKALFVPGGLSDGTDVGYYVKGQRYLNGVKMGVGILCSCCDQVVSCSQFEQHAGWGSRRNPYSSIYLADGQSLHIAALALGQNIGDAAPVENVDYCTECGDGGELVLCDSCPGAYHPECAGLVSIPAGNWFCPRCKNQRNTIPGSGRKVNSKIKTRGGSKAGGGATAAKGSLDDRCTRLLKATDTVSSGCVFCRSGEFEKTGFGPRTILLCDQCEREYHVGCLKDQGLANLEALPEGEWFCGKDCQHIHSILHLLVANGMEPLVYSIISQVIQNKVPQGQNEEERVLEKHNFAWQLLHGRRGDPLNGKTLSQAAAIFAESFDPIVDESSGRDLIPLMVHRVTQVVQIVVEVCHTCFNLEFVWMMVDWPACRNIRDQDFGGMHCVVLKRNDEVVTAALVRIFGRQFAELPLVATKAGSTGQGYCKALILSIERLLGILNVERLVLPAAEGAEGIWVKKFAFSQLSDEESRKYRSEVQMMIFKGSSLLQKCITPVAIM